LIYEYEDVPACENELSMSGILKVTALQTDKQTGTQTDATERNTMPHRG